MLVALELGAPPTTTMLFEWDSIALTEGAPRRVVDFHTTMHGWPSAHAAIVLCESPTQASKHNVVYSGSATRSDSEFLPLKHANVAYNACPVALAD